MAGNVVDITEDLFARMREMTPAGLDVDLPPKVSLEMGGIFVQYEEGKSLTSQYPAVPKFGGPARIYQGGILVAAMDGTCGALSLLATGKLYTTIELDASFIRPIPVGPATFDVTATIIRQTRRLLFMEAKVVTEGNRVAATSSSTWTRVDESS